MAVLFLARQITRIIAKAALMLAFFATVAIIGGGGISAIAEAFGP